MPMDTQDSIKEEEPTDMPEEEVISEEADDFATGDQVNASIEVEENLIESEKDDEETGEIDMEVSDGMIKMASTAQLVNNKSIEGHEVSIEVKEAYHGRVASAEEMKSND